MKTIDELLKKYNEYAASGGNLQEEQLVAIIVNAMPRDYRAIIHAYVATATENHRSLTMEGMVTHITTAAQVNQAQDRREHDEATAMAARGRAPGRGGRGRGTTRGRGDWRENNRQRDDRKMEGNWRDRRPREDSNEIRCHNCEGYGHIARDCTSRRRESKRSPGRDDGRWKAKAKSAMRS